jgi:trk system potassium uptake protein TrkA
MRIIISGAYAIGTYLAKLLSRNEEDITLIDEDADRLAEIGSDYDLLTLEANPGSIRTLKEAGAPNADLYIAVTKSEALNLNTCILAKALGTKKNRRRNRKLRIH